MKKNMWTILPWVALNRVSEIMTHGMGKYGKDTWRQYSVDEQLDAAMRHINAHLRGEVVNSDDWGLNHLEHAATRLLMASETLRNGEEQEVPKPIYTVKLPPDIEKQLRKFRGKK